MILNDAHNGSIHVSHVQLDDPDQLKRPGLSMRAHKRQSYYALLSMNLQFINMTLSAFVQVEHTPPVHKRILDVLPGVSGGVARVMVSS